jgi:hypothetical protein
MGAPSDKGPHRVVKRTAHGGEHFLNNPVPNAAFVLSLRFDAAAREAFPDATYKKFVLD